MLGTISATGSSGQRDGAGRRGVDYFINRVHCAVSVYCWNATILSP